MTIITNFYLNGRVYHTMRYGRSITTDIIQGTYGELSGFRTDTYRIPR